MPSVLIVDDNDNFRHNVAELLQFEGFKVIQAENPVIGFKQMVEYRPDLILLDLGFHGFDGISFINWVRSNHSSATVPIIVVSGFKDAEHIREAISSGANDYLVKPIDIGKMIERIQNQLVSAQLP
jgi:DNA-binding response OmpR family regulator